MQKSFFILTYYRYCTVPVSLPTWPDSWAGLKDLGIRKVMSSRKKGDAQYAKPELQVASANSVKVRVVCRIRPLLQREIDAQPENSVSPLKIIDANTIEVYNDKEEHAFIIDRVYGIDTSQLQVLTVTHLLTHSPNHLLTHSITHSCTKAHVLH